MSVWVSGNNSHWWWCDRSCRLTLKVASKLNCGNNFIMSDPNPLSYESHVGHVHHPTLKNAVFSTKIKSNKCQDNRIFSYKDMTTGVFLTVCGKSQRREVKLWFLQNLQINRNLWFIFSLAHFLCLLHLSLRFVVVRDSSKKIFQKKGSSPHVNFRVPKY